MKNYLQALTNAQGADLAKNATSYIIVVRSKYLQIITAYYIYQNDFVRIEKEFALFNEFFEGLMAIHMDVFGVKFEPPEPNFNPSDFSHHEESEMGLSDPSSDNAVKIMSREAVTKNADKLQELLESLNLEALLQHMHEEEIDWTTLMLCESEEDFIQLGISKKGQRFKLMKAVKDMQQTSTESSQGAEPTDRDEPSPQGSLSHSQSTEELSAKQQGKAVMCSIVKSQPSFRTL